MRAVKNEAEFYGILPLGEFSGHLLVGVCCVLLGCAVGLGMCVRGCVVFCMSGVCVCVCVCVCVVCVCVCVCVCVRVRGCVVFCV